MSPLLAHAQVSGNEATSAVRNMPCTALCSKQALPRMSRQRSCRQTSVKSRVFATSPATSPGLEEAPGTKSLNLYSRLEQVLDGRGRRNVTMSQILQALDEGLVDAALRTHEAHNALSDAIRAEEGVKEATEEYEGTLMQMKMLLVNRPGSQTLNGVVESIQAGLGPGPGFQVKPLSQPPPIHPVDLRYWAVIWNDLRMLVLLLEYAYRPVQAYSQGFMALHCAVERNFVEAVELLLSRGADIDAEDKKGSTALHCAAKQNLVKMAELLLSHAADVSIENNKGDTALHVAARYAGTDFVNLLLQHGSDPGKENAKGLVPFDLANQRGIKKMVQVLVNASIAAEAWVYEEMRDDEC
ncbi:hypothetical protein ABBQ38_008734 [Trebouxia sp. C0009 RCD-2024]